MAAPRSVTPWDIIVQKQGDVLIFDKRPLSRIGKFTHTSVTLFCFLIYFYISAST
jgi:hypothetical protein